MKRHCIKFHKPLLEHLIVYFSAMISTDDFKERGFREDVVLGLRKVS